MFAQTELNPVRNYVCQFAYDLSFRDWVLIFGAAVLILLMLGIYNHWRRTNLSNPYMQTLKFFGAMVPVILLLAYVGSMGLCWLFQILG